MVAYDLEVSHIHRKRLTSALKNKVENMVENVFVYYESVHNDDLLYCFGWQMLAFITFFCMKFLNVKYNKV